MMAVDGIEKPGTGTAINPERGDVPGLKFDLH
jgi:hypothetical protein